MVKARLEDKWGKLVGMYDVPKVAVTPDIIDGVSSMEPQSVTIDDRIYIRVIGGLHLVQLTYRESLGVYRLEKE